ncbi:hypothetical protein PGIGA_G00174450 [Pangasianodon gigas]|uniref:Uncharacterized protein n=1 Tax=Pangasianodon gigas TaxID=30993 RepID=A0ACC5XUC5_PANGG|nr:hypothetical protein [Pangasianodon gigas]
MASKFSRKSSSHSEEEMNKVKEENAYLRKTLEEVCRQKEAPSDSQNNHCFLERILALETLREKNSQQILAKDQEIASLRQLLRSDSAEVVTSLHAQLNQQRADAEMRERLFQALKQETEELKNKLAAVSAKCQVLENTGKSGTADGHAATGNSTLIEEQLKDALEKNQQWLVYDQQREAYVKAVLAETYQLEQELRQAHKALQQKEKEEERDVEIQQCYEKLVGELEREQQKGQQLLTEHQQLRKELEEERLKSAELQQQVNILQKSLLNQHEDQSRMTVLEQQIQLSARDLEDEKRDNQHLQWQLHRVLKELRKAKDKVAILESEKAQRETSSSVSNACTELESVPKDPKSFTSPTRAHNLLDESFLECPNCRVQYPTSRHRELLVHIDQCFDTN